MRWGSTNLLKGSKKCQPLRTKIRISSSSVDEFRCTVTSRKNDRSLSRKKSNLLFLTHHSKPSFFRDFFSRGASHHFTVIILAGFFFHAKRKNPSFQWNYVFHRWKNNDSFLRCSTLLLLHRFLKLRAKVWRPQRVRYVVTYPAVLIPRALWVVSKTTCGNAAHIFLCLELSSPVAHTNCACYH